MLLVGDTYQIESISFGNWFSMTKYFIPRYAWHELETPYRTKDEALLTFWKKVRELADDMTEHSSNVCLQCIERRVGLACAVAKLNRGDSRKKPPPKGSGTIVKHRILLLDYLKDL